MIKSGMIVSPEYLVQGGIVSENVFFLKIDLCVIKSFWILEGRWGGGGQFEKKLVF